MASATQEESIPWRGRPELALISSLVRFVTIEARGGITNDVDAGTALTPTRTPAGHAGSATASLVFPCCQGRYAGAAKGTRRGDGSQPAVNPAQDVEAAIANPVNERAALVRVQSVIAPELAPAARLRRQGGRGPLQNETLVRLHFNLATTLTSRRMATMYV